MLSRLIGPLRPARAPYGRSANVLTRLKSTLSISDEFSRSYINQMCDKDIHNTSPQTSLLEPSDNFPSRHLGTCHQSDYDKMCSVIGVSSVDQLISETIPEHVRRDLDSDPLTIQTDPTSESVALAKIKSILSRNIVATNFIGQGYYGTITPSVIQRNLLENPAWYTAYTPYQAEISQGRLQSLFIFQTLVANLTNMEVANCSLLDEGTAAAEAMSMFARSVKSLNKQNKFLIADSVHPQTITVIQTRARWMGVDCQVVSNVESAEKINMDKVFGVLVQYPDTYGRLIDYSTLTSHVHASGAKICVATDPLALTICEPPIGVDAMVGTMQRFGVPMFFGGPHAGFLATSKSEVRRMPGRLIGESVDAQGNPALRLTLQTREQHIRLDKATSNICTSQALLANMAAMYAVYHGPAGLTRIACRVHGLAELFVASVPIGKVEEGKNFFDTVTLNVSPMSATFVADMLETEYGINVRRLDESRIAVAFDETHTQSDVDILNQALRGVGIEFIDQGSGVVTDTTEDKILRRFDGQSLANVTGLVPDQFRRKVASKLLPQKIFNSIQTETEMMRFLYSLQLKDLSLTNSMITLGSCTMKLNSASSMMPCSWPEIAHMHPFAPKSNTKGYITMLEELCRFLCTITGMDDCSLQPMSGASGEYAGLLAIRKYLESVGEGHRNVVIIPRSAHGTNPASAAMIGLQIKWIDDSGEGGIDLEEFHSLCESNKDSLAALMITYPSTHGIFEESINTICDIVHKFGGNVYMDGANMNAQLGLTSPGLIGADVCHLNLHKTFSIPHGGGGPGLGPICVKSHLAPFLPGHVQDTSGILTSGNDQNLSAVSSAPFGQAGIAVIPWMFISMLGGSGLLESGRQAILNANYMASRLQKFYPMPFMNKNNRCSHEFIIDVSHIKEKTGIAEEDIAKRLMDYGFHAPTMSWPVHSSLMIEPTESENLAELDRFVDAMISIRGEIEKIETGEWDKVNNPLKNAPHTQSVVCASEWKYPYSREVAAFPLAYIRERGKFWPSTSRVSNTIGDKNLILVLKE